MGQDLKSICHINQPVAWESNMVQELRISAHVNQPVALQDSTVQESTYC